MATAIKLALVNWRTSGSAFVAVLLQIVNALMADPNFEPYLDKLTIVALILGQFVSRDARVTDQKAGLRPETGAVEK